MIPGYDRHHTFLASSPGRRGDDDALTFSSAAPRIGPEEECYASLNHTERQGISYRGTLPFMSATPLPNPLLVAADAGLYAHLQRLASAQRCVFFAGLPGTGKSLLSHQLTHLAHALGRTVHMLQWDMARPVFEASAAGQRYPVVHGVTHGVIRKAAGLWARVRCSGTSVILRPAICSSARHRLWAIASLNSHVSVRMPLSHCADGLFRRACAFPCRTASSARSCRPAARHAPPTRARTRRRATTSLDDLWRHLARIAPALGVGAALPASAAEVPYDPTLYQAVYQRLLTQRQVLVWPMDTILPTTTLSVLRFCCATA